MTDFGGPNSVVTLLFCASCTCAVSAGVKGDVTIDEHGLKLHLVRALETNDRVGFGNDHHCSERPRESAIVKK